LIHEYKREFFFKSCYETSMGAAWKNDGARGVLVDRIHRADAIAVAILDLDLAIRALPVLSILVGVGRLPRVVANTATDTISIHLALTGAICCVCIGAALGKLSLFCVVCVGFIILACS
jgi:hypothetical protein